MVHCTFALTGKPRECMGQVKEILGLALTRRFRQLLSDL